MLNPERACAQARNGREVCFIQEDKTRINVSRDQAAAANKTPSLTKGSGVVGYVLPVAKSDTLPVQTGVVRSLPVRPNRRLKRGLLAGYRRWARRTIESHPFKPDDY